MYASASHAQQNHLPHHHPAAAAAVGAHLLPHIQHVPNGHAHVPNGHHPQHHPAGPHPQHHPAPPPHQQPPPPPPPQGRNRSQSALPQFDPVLVHAIPSVSYEGDRQIVGGSQSTSVRHYTPIKVVGDGSFGTVWLCDWHGALPPKTPISHMQRNASARPEYAGKRLVAVKRMRRRWEGGWDECSKLKELESLRSIRYHPNIIPLYDFFLLPESKELYFVFESMEGNLYQLIKSRRNRPLAGGLVHSIFHQVISALHHIHQSGYFHRDMKPENLLVTTTGLHDYATLNPTAPPGAPPEKDVVVIIKIADFGLARETASAPPYTEYVSTRWYRAPEVLLRARAYGSPVDMWAFGAIMAELVDLRPLFPGSDEMDQVHKVCAVLGDPSDEYGVDARGKPLGGGRWEKGHKLARRVGCAFPKSPPQNLFAHFHHSVPPRLIECIVDLLRYDPDARLTSQQCLEHPYVLDGARVAGPPVPVPAPAPALRGSASDPSVGRSHRLAAAPPPVPPLPEMYARTAQANGVPAPAPAQRPAFGGALYPPEAGWPQAASMPNIPGAGEPMDVVVPAAEAPGQPMEGVVAQADEPGALPAAKPGVFGALGFRKKSGWGFGKLARHGDKAPLPTVEEMPALSRKRSQSGSSGTRSFDGARGGEQPAPGGQQDPKKVRKEAERMFREAEKQRRELAHKNAREASRAVMAKRQMIRDDAEGLEWHKAAQYFNEPGAQGDAQRPPLPGGAPPTAAPGVPPTAAPGVPPLPPVPVPVADGFTDFGSGKQPSSGAIRQQHHAAGPVDTFNAAGARFASPPLEDRGGGWREDPRLYKARRRELDEYSVSSSDVHSVSHVSAISFATVDSDPGPARHRRGQSAFSMPRMTSTSSLRTSFDTSASADFPQSVRSSNSFSLEHQLVEDLARARLHHGAPPPPPGTLSPPPLHTLSLGAHQPWHSPGSDATAPASPAGRGLQQPTYIALPPPRISPHLHARSMSPYMSPPSPGYAPKSAVNPIFQVTAFPSTATTATESPTPPSLPPFAQLEAVADGDHPPLSPMSFSVPEDA